MKKLSVNLQNCYGIKQLKHDFDFVFPDQNGGETETKSFVIYAPNGSMKTSFAKVFSKFQLGEEKDIKDLIFNKTPIVKEIKIDNQAINKDEIFVIKSFASTYESKKIASLLIDDSLQSKLKYVLENRSLFLKSLEKYCGLKTEKTSKGEKVFELENQLLEDFKIKSFLQNLSKFDLKSVHYDFSDIQYSEIFDPTIIKKIETEEFQNKIKDFLSKSDEIYKDYSFLKKGKFSLGKLRDVSKKLGENNFFVKENKVFLDGLKDEIKSTKDLNKEIKKIEDQLKETEEFQKIEKLLSDTKGLRLKDIIEKKPEIIEELEKSNLNKFKEKLWLSYFKQNEEKFNDLKENFNQFSIEKDSKPFNETPWKKAYKTFTERFTVPFEMEIDNIKSSVLGESLPKVIFKFWDEEKEEWIEHNREKIEDEILSQGEKRALYLINIVFDIEERKITNKKTLFIIDDIADSFDYKNKYAIVEYLKEIAENDNFYSIILTHNFDFYRTITSRLKANEKNRLHASKLKDKIILKPEEYQKEPFNEWKKSLNEKNIIALIPFVRNLVEFGKNNAKYFTILTHLLHKKAELRYFQNGNVVPISKTNDYNETNKDFTVVETNKLLFGDIEEIYKEYLGIDSFDSSIKSKSIYDEIISLANTTINSNLEDKIILAIIIRLEAEKFMIQKINNNNVVNKISNSQTTGLIDKIKGKIKAGDITNVSEENIKILESVNIMTPENIHLNSFMYEPILDMGIDELKNLYEKVKNLNS